MANDPFVDFPAGWALLAFLAHNPSNTSRPIWVRITGSDARTTTDFPTLPYIELALNWFF